MYRAGAEKLDGALRWLNGVGEGIDPALAMLSVLEDLVPPTHGQIEEVEIKGQLLGNKGPVVLNRESTRKVKRAISRRRERQRQLLATEGRVGEFDKDKLLFTLRDRPSSEADVTCSFSEEHYDDLFDAFVSDQRVGIQGRWSADRRVLEVAAVETIGPATIAADEQ